jgi:zinc transport system ATP-binding protein
MIQLTGIRVTRGATGVVDGLDLELVPGRVFWLVGPNGAGKSSLLRVIVGLDPPGRGTVTRTGGPIRYFNSEMSLPPTATVGDWGRLLRRTGPDGESGGPSSLWPDVEPGRRISRLSTGQRKRLLLDAVLRQPGDLALDEPFEHLSPGGKAALGSMLRDRARTRVVVVATNQFTPRDPGDRALHLEAGTARTVEARQVAP